LPASSARLGRRGRRGGGGGQPGDLVDSGEDGEKGVNFVGATEWEARAALATGRRACVRVGLG
tara:strand:- start:104 stop:292 length:189 start_codon:yes stop_codon:yes gene_type:complete